MLRITGMHMLEEERCLQREELPARFEAEVIRESSIVEQEMAKGKFEQSIVKDIQRDFRFVTGTYSRDTPTYIDCMQQTQQDTKRGEGEVRICDSMYSQNVELEVVVLTNH